MTNIRTVLSAAVVMTALAQPVGAALMPVSGNDSGTFTFTVPVQLETVHALRSPEIWCGVGSGTSVDVSPGQQSLFVSRNADGSPARIVGEGRAPIPTGPSFRDNIIVTVLARAFASTAHSYACMLTAYGGPLRNPSSKARPAMYDPATFKPIVSGPIQ